MQIAIVVLTYNRLHLLRECVDNVLSRISDKTAEILFWDNNSTDGTAAYLDALTLPKMRVVHHGENLGLNAYDPAIQATTSEYIVGLDEDVIDAPYGWDETLLEAFVALPDIGFLASNLVDNPHDVTSRIMYHRDDHLYRIVERNGFRLKIGPVGGWCAMTSRELHTKAGGIGRNRKSVYWHWDGAYLGKLDKIGYGGAILDDLKVTHAGGEYYSRIFPEKKEFYTEYHKQIARKNRVKRVLLRMPFVRSLNAHFQWFQPPE